MATTRRQGKPATSKSTIPVREETLEEFDAALDAHLGYPSGFATTVVKLWDTRQQIKQINDARAALFDGIKEVYLNNGPMTVEGTEYVIRRAADSAAETYKGVDSATVKKHAAETWRLCQTSVPFVQVRAPSNVIPTRVDGLPRLPARAADAASLAHVVTTYKEHPAWAAAKELRDTETELTAHLDKLAAAVGDWDGLPMTFADGWTAGLRRIQFSADKLRQLAPEVFDRLAVTKVKQIAGRVYVGKPDADDGAVDLDAD